MEWVSPVVQASSCKIFQFKCIHTVEQLIIRLSFSDREFYVIACLCVTVCSWEGTPSDRYRNRQTDIGSIIRATLHKYEKTDYYANTTESGVLEANPIPTPNDKL